MAVFPEPDGPQSKTFLPTKVAKFNIILVLICSNKEMKGIVIHIYRDISEHLVLINITHMYAYAKSMHTSHTLLTHTQTFTIAYT